MTAFAKYNCFVEDVAEKVHNLGADALKIALTNRAPVVGSDVGFSDISEIAAGNGYAAGGNAPAISSSAQTGGVYKLTLADPATWTAVGGTIGPFRYAVLYNDTASGKRLIGYWDYGVSVTLQIAETFTVDLDQVNGTLTLT